MNYTEYKAILYTFSKKEIIDFLGEKIYNSIIEWTSSDDAYTKGTLIDILVSNNGFTLFKNKQFRQRFFKSVSYNDLQLLLGDFTSSYEELASNAAKIDFKNSEFYLNLFDKVLKCPEYQFDDNVIESKLEEIHGTTEKFYELLDYQYLIKQQVVYELSKPGPLGRRVLVHMPTGTGKTKTTMHILSYYFNFLADENSYVLWIAHTNVLLNQALETFKNVWGHLGLSNVNVEKSWGQGDYFLQNGILFITIQALQTLKRLDKNKYDEICNRTTLVVYDECHKIGASETNQVVNDLLKPSSITKKHFIGLTATPGRSTDYSVENRIFNEFFNRKITIDIPTIERISKGAIAAQNISNTTDIIKYFQDRNILSVLEKEVLDYEVDENILKEIKKQINSDSLDEFTPKLLEKIANNKARNSVILNRLKELYSQNKPTIVFACSVAHAQMLSAFLNIENIPNALVYGKMPNSVRKKAIESFKDKNNPINIIINFDILTTGFDSTNIECVFITRPTKSIILYSQMIGRGLRGKQMGGSETCKLIDVKENLEIYNENEAFSHFDSYWR